MPKYLVSSTLENPSWANTTVIAGDVVDAIKQLKQEPGQDIVQYGFGRVSRLLLEHDLLDELRLWFHPQFVGKGTSDDLLFPHGLPTQFERTDTVDLKSGITILTYRTVVR